MQNYARFVVLQFGCLVRCNMCWFGVAVLPAFCDDCCVSFGLSVLQPFACFFFSLCVIQSIWVRLGLELECWYVYVC